METKSKKIEVKSDHLIVTDDIKKLMPEFANGANADGVHLESSIINARILDRASQNGDNIIYPTTGRSMEKLNAVINKAEGRGYTK